MPILLRSLTAKLVLATTFCVTLSLGFFVFVANGKLDGAADQQGQAIARFTQERIANEMLLEARLARSVFQHSIRQGEEDLTSLAQRQEAINIAGRGNIVAIDLLLGQEVATGTLDGVLMLDKGMRALGSHRPGLNLLAVNQLLAASDFFQDARASALVSDPSQRKGRKAVFQGRDPLLAAVGLTASADAAAVVHVVPMFDDFGDVLAILVGFQTIGGETSVLSEFARAERAEVSLQRNGVVLASWNAGDTIVRNYGPSRCVDLDGGEQICAAAAVDAVISETRELTASVREEVRDLSLWIVIIAIGSTIFAAILSTLLTRRVMSPLADITALVRSVARGNWLAPIRGATRRDEVGRIARAVKVLQRSMREREELQASAEDIETLAMREAALQARAGQCSVALRYEASLLAEQCEVAKKSAHDLQEYVRISEGRIDEVRLLTSLAMEEELDVNAPAGASSDRTTNKASSQSTQSYADIAAGLDEISRKFELLSGSMACLNSEIQAIDDRGSVLQQIISGFVNRIDEGSSEPDAPDHMQELEPPPLRLVAG